MAEHSSGSKGFAKVLSRKVNRTKEKVLQNLGKADKTTDEGYDVNVANFSQQQAAANKLQKELKNYLSHVKAMSAASTSLYTTVSETYEGDWTGYTEMVGSVTHLRALWEDYMENLTNNVQQQVSVYISKFPDIRNKMQKRGRKLVDFDRARHSLNDLEHAKKRDEVKIQKATVEMEEAKRVYEEINNELRDELPDLYESRINTLAGTFLNLFMFEGKFEEATSKVKGGLEDVTQELQKQTTKTMFTTPYSLKNRNGPGGGLDSTGLNLSGLESTPSRNVDSHRISNSGGSIESDADKRSTSRTSTGGSEDGEMGYKQKHVYTPLNGDVEYKAAPHSTEYEEMHTAPQVRTSEFDDSSGRKSGDLSSQPDSRSSGGSYHPQPAARQSAGEEEDYAVPTSKPVPPPEGVLFQVLATHAYAGEDVDELTFELGDVINVIPFEDPDDQDEGWLYGYHINKTSKDAGVFPENFTKRM